MNQTVLTNKTVTDCNSYNKNSLTLIVFMDLAYKRFAMYSCEYILYI